MTRDDQIQRDLGLKLSIAIEQLLQRETAIAERMLPNANLAQLLLNTAGGVNASIASAILQMRKRSGSVDEQFNIVAGQIATMIFASKASVLDGLSLIEAGRPDEALRRYGSERRR
ncbi:hypothetical protein [uncultured Sphingomonas sp.]|uniref:hypothetical protein n=1 Tax=uncultured Sphingomonas sp. TaxID=158754 RepID=UPI003749BB1D